LPQGATGRHRPPNPQGHIGAPGWHLELHVAIWSSTQPFGAPHGHLDLQTATWNSKWHPGTPNGTLELQMAPWSSRRLPGAANCPLELQFPTWTSKSPPGAPNGHLELQMATCGIPNGTLGFQRPTWLTLKAAIRASSLQSAPPGCNLSLQAAV